MHVPPIALVTARPQCNRHDDCPDPEACHQGSCQDAFRLQVCGTNAQCSANKHLAKCECLPNTSGNPTVACQSCKSIKSSIYVVYLSICMFTCLPIIAAPSTEPSLAAGCSNNDDCPEFTACENLQCINPCAQSDPCAPLATCRVISHKVVCTCPNGYIGTPQTSCQPRKYKAKALKCLL